MKPIKVNGVVVCCSNCINHQVSPLDEPCKDCWKAIFHSGNIDEVRLDDIVFYPADNDSIAIGVQGVICVIVDSSPHIGVRWNEKVVGGHDCHGACSHGYGWFVTPCDIKRIDDDDEFDADTTEFDKLFESFSREAIS